MHRHIIHLHIPAFPIAVERVCHPELRDRPVAVAPLHSERALILSVSPEACREGIFKGMPLGKAMKFCPGLSVLPPNPGLTERACQVLANMAARYTPLWEPSRSGHIYLDVTGTERLWGRAKEAAGRLRREIKNHLRLPGTAGVAGNKMVSSIASKIMPSEGVIDVNCGQESSFVAPLRVSVLPGIGHIRKKILLEDLNISLVQEIAAMDMANLKLIFGRQAHVIHQRSLGIDPTPVYPPRRKPMVVEEITLSGDENDDRILLGIIYRLVERCSRRLRRRALLPLKAGLVLRYADQVEIIRQINLPLSAPACPDTADRGGHAQAGHGSFRDFDLYGFLESIFLKACRRRVRIRFMRVWFQDFSSPAPQLSLFPTTSPDAEKKALVTRALDRIRERYGDEAIKYGRAA